VVIDSQSAGLLSQLTAANQGDVHLVGGPRTIETFRSLGALDTIELVVLPLFFGAGMRLTTALSPDAALSFEGERVPFGRLGRDRLPVRGSPRAAAEPPSEPASGHLTRRLPPTPNVPATDGATPS
jgi:dihydrofolate reductase